MNSRNKLLGIAGLGWLFDAMDVGLLSFVMVAVAKEWMLSSQQVAWIGSVNSIGMAVGAFAFGVLADRKSRRFVFIATLLLFTIASGLTALASTLAVFLILRFFIGMGLGGELPVASTLVSESVAAHERGRVVVLLESFWALGWILAALIGYFVVVRYGWRVAMLLSALPAVYAVYLRLHLPNDAAQRAPSGHGALSSWQRMRLLWCGDYRKATLMLWILWFTVVFSYYGMFLWLPSVLVHKGFDVVKSFEYVLLMTLAQLPGYFSAAYLIERFGRKFVLVSYLLGTALAAVLFGAAQTKLHLLLSGAALSFFNLGAWGALYAYTPEQYPDQIRATGAGIAAAVGRIGGILGPLLVGYMVGYGHSSTNIFLSFCIAIVIGVVAVVALGSETRNKPLLSLRHGESSGVLEK